MSSRSSLYNSLPQLHTTHPDKTSKLGSLLWQAVVLLLFLALLLLISSEAAAGQTQTIFPLIPPVLLELAVATPIT